MLPEAQRLFICIQAYHVARAGMIVICLYYAFRPFFRYLNFTSDMVDMAEKGLIEDMNDGNIPQECNVLYDEMGSRPEVTVTDAETITDLYNRLALMSVGEKSDMSITDSYHHIRFTLQDGTTVGWNFEGKDLLNIGTENYDVKDEGNLWFAVRQLQEKAMGNEEVTDYEEPADGK